MELLEAIKARHSVRSYTDQPLEGEVLAQLRQTIDACNRESGLNIQLCLNAPEAFTGMMARYGKFSGVNNYIALVGKKEDVLEEKCGYQGEKIVLRAQQLGLNTCWVASTYSKGKTVAAVGPGEKLLMVIAIGYGKTQGVPHRGKSAQELCRVEGPMPEWFRSGMEASALAPTTINQQKFRFTLRGDRVSATAGTGFHAKTDLGIAKYHFELGAGNSGWAWETPA